MVLENIKLFENNYVKLFERFLYWKFKYLLKIIELRVAKLIYFRKFDEERFSGWVVLLNFKGGWL